MSRNEIGAPSFTAASSELSAGGHVGEAMSLMNRLFGRARAKAEQLADDEEASAALPARLERVQRARDPQAKPE